MSERFSTRTREQWIEWIDSACPHVPGVFKSGCGDCWMEVVHEARRLALEEAAGMCDDHDLTCLDPQGCDVTTVAAAIRARAQGAPHD